MMESGELAKINYSALKLKSILNLIQSAILLDALNTNIQHQLMKVTTIQSIMQYQTLDKIEL
jgi:hypothetical protein